MTQQQLADHLRVSQQTLAHYEVGRVGIGAAMLPTLSDLLDLSLDELLMGRPTSRIPGKRGPASRLEQQIDAVTRLPSSPHRQHMVGRIRRPSRRAAFRSGVTAHRPAQAINSFASGWLAQILPEHESTIIDTEDLVMRRGMVLEDLAAEAIRPAPRSWISTVRHIM